MLDVKGSLIVPQLKGGWNVSSTVLYKTMVRAAVQVIASVLREDTKNKYRDQNMMLLFRREQDGEDQEWGQGWDGLNMTMNILRDSEAGSDWQEIYG